jgi:predicted nucleotidyltransferase
MGNSLDLARISEALFTRTQAQVLGLLFGQPNRSFTTSEVVRQAGKGVGAVHRELLRLLSAGLVTSTRTGNQRHYQADPESPVFPELAAIVAKLSRPPMAAAAVAEEAGAYVVGDGIRIPRESLAALCREYHVSQLSLFGSITRPDFAADSDVDVLVDFEPGHVPGMGGIVDLRDGLSRLFGGRKVDVATRAILNNPYRRKAIDRDLYTLYATR